MKLNLKKTLGEHIPPPISLQKLTHWKIKFYVKRIFSIFKTLKIKFRYGIIDTYILIVIHLALTIYMFVVVDRSQPKFIKNNQEFFVNKLTDR